MEKALKMGKVSATGSFQLFIGKATSTIIMAVGAIILARLLSPAEYGLYSSLPTIIVNNLELAKELEINPEKDLIHVKIIDSVYKDLYSKEQNFKSIHSIGCPLTSAIACALAKTTGKLVAIVKDTISPDSKTIEVWYQTLEA